MSEQEKAFIQQFEELCQQLDTSDEYAEMIEAQYEVMEERLADPDDDLGERLSMSMMSFGMNTGPKPMPTPGGGKGLGVSPGKGGGNCAPLPGGGGSDGELMA